MPCRCQLPSIALPLVVSFFLNKLVLTSREVIIIQSEPEKQDKNQSSKIKFRNLSHFELKFYKRVGF